MRSAPARLPLLLALVALACVDPADRRPGLWLSGEVVPGPVDDWSFTADYPEIMIETRTPYGIPHSVTIVCADRANRLYVGARDPATKRWVANVDRDPEVRLKIGGRIYEQRLVPVTDPKEHERVYRSYVEKYEREVVPPEQRPAMRYFEVVERG